MKYIAGIGLLVVLFGGLNWLVASSQYRSLRETHATIDIQAARGSMAIGPMTVSHSTCRYILPNSALERLLQNLTCRRCVNDAADIRVAYDVRLLDEQCHQRGNNTMQFTPRK